MRERSDRAVGGPRCGRGWVGKTGSVGARRMRTPPCVSSLRALAPETIRSAPHKARLNPSRLWRPYGHLARCLAAPTHARTVAPRRRSRSAEGSLTAWRPKGAHGWRCPRARRPRTPHAHRAPPADLGSPPATTPADAFGPLSPPKILTYDPLHGPLGFGDRAPRYIESHVVAVTSEQPLGFWLRKRAQDIDEEIRLHEDVLHRALSSIARRTTAPEAAGTTSMRSARPGTPAHAGADPGTRHPTQSERPWLSAGRTWFMEPVSRIGGASWIALNPLSHVRAPPRALQALLFPVP